MVQATFRDIATRSPEEALRLLSSSVADGLSPDDATQRLGVCGANELSGVETTASRIFLRQFKSSFVYLLFAACAIALYLREYLDASVILLFLVINALLGFFQEHRAVHALDGIAMLHVELQT